jgi:hypothetical protein
MRYRLTSMEYNVFYRWQKYFEFVGNVRVGGNHGLDLAQSAESIKPVTILRCCK